MDNKTGKRTSLRKATEDEARQIVEARNQAERQPVLNRQIAKAYLAGFFNSASVMKMPRIILSRARRVAPYCRISSGLVSRPATMPASTITATMKGWNGRDRRMT